MKISQAELIGLRSEVVDSKNRSNIGIKGTIRDETKNTITIGKKRLFKKNITIRITKDKEEITIKGEKLAGRPKERIKNG